MSLSSPLFSALPTFSPLNPIDTSSPSPLVPHRRPTETSGVSANGNGSQQSTPSPLASAALYLYTFLATLVLLIGISLFIVIRSVVLRRRRNRVVRAALLRYTNGSTPFGQDDLELMRLVGLRMNSPPGARSLVVDLNKTPSIWEVRLAPTTKSIVLEKTAEGKVISSSWKLHHRSHTDLDLKSDLSLRWSWPSILPLSSTLLSPQATHGDKDTNPTGSTTTGGNLNGRGSVPLSRLFERLLLGPGSTSRSALRVAQGTETAYDQSRQNVPAAPSTTPNNANLNPIDSVGGGTPAPSHTDNHPHADTHAEADRQPGEGTLHMRGSSGSSSQNSNSNSDSDTTIANLDQMPPNAATSTTTTERAASGTSDQQPGQGLVVEVGEAHISSQIPFNSNQSHPQSPNPNQKQKQNRNHHRQPKSLGMMGIDERKTTRMRVAVLVCMPTPPPPLPSNTTPSPHSDGGLSKAKSKAKAESGHEPNDSVDEKRLSSSSLVSTLGDGKHGDAEIDIDGVQLPVLEVGLADVDVDAFSDFGSGGGQGGEGTIGER